VIRLAGRAWGQVTTEALAVTAGAGALDSMVARAAARAGIAGLEFYAGIPGSIGGALTMNAGCYGAETKDVLVSAWGLTRSGERVDYALADFGYTYRHSEAPADIIWVEATFRGAADEPAAVQARIDEITSRREQTQPIREKTGGSTFKNPPGHSSWKLVDEAGWRGRLHAVTGGGAMFSDLHANFMINPGEATAADIEGLGEAVRADVLAKTGVQLDWEIRRIGRAGA
jgi:UDP-N-acetylmuramate dehydrogenase